MDMYLPMDFLCLLQVKYDIATSVFCEPIRMTDLLDCVTSVREKFILPIDSCPETDTLWHSQGELFSDKEIGAKMELSIFYYSTLFQEWRISVCTLGNGKTGKSVAQFVCWKHEGRKRCLVEAVSVALHPPSTQQMTSLSVGSCQNSPYRKIDGTQTERTFPTDDGIFDIAVGETVPCRKDIGVYCIAARFPISGELREEIVVVGISLRSCEKIVKDRSSLLIITPKYAEIVPHRNSLSFTIFLDYR